MFATHTGQLDLPQLPPEAKQAYIVPELANKSLLSIAQLCTAGCTVNFDKDKFSVQYKGNIALTGHRSSKSGLYQLDEPAATTRAATDNDNIVPAHTGMRATATTACQPAQQANSSTLATDNTTGAPANNQPATDSGFAAPANNALQLATAIPANQTATATPANQLATEPPANYEQTAATASGITTPAEIVKFLHAAFGYPTIKTLLTALDKGHIHGVEGLSSTLVKRHPPYHIATGKGHMAQSRRNQRSTKPKSKPLKDHTVASTTSKPSANSAQVDKLVSTKKAGQEVFNVFQVDDGIDALEEDDDDDTNNPETAYCYATTHAPTDRTYSDQTGRFIIESSVGNNYIFVLYDQASNSILAEPIPNRQDKTLTAAFIKLHDTLLSGGSRPRMHIVDNECGTLMKQAFVNKQLPYQLVPPGIHRRNAAERAIRTFKDHLIAILSGTDPSFPLHLWDKLIPQATMTLNLMRQSRIQPKQSAYSQLNGPFIFDKTPIAPLGSKVLVHIKPHERTTWSPRAEEGYYIGPAMEHYRCYQCYVSSTRDYRISDTVSWAPSSVRAPTSTSTDVIVRAIEEITDAIRHPTPGAPHTPYETSSIPALRQLASMYDGKGPSNNTTQTMQRAGEMRVEATATTPSDPQSTSQPDGEMRVDGIVLPPMGDIPRPPTAAYPENWLDGEATFENSTGHAGEKRRAEARKQKKIAAAKAQSNKDSTNKKRRTTAPRRKRPKPKLRDQHATFAFVMEHDEETGTTNFALHTAILDVTIAAEEYALHGHAINPDTGGIAEYGELIQCSHGPLWLEAMADEIGRLMNGHDTMRSGSNTMRFIRYHDIPKNFLATYCRIVCADRPEKANRYRVRMTVGGDRLEYSGNASTKTCDIIVVKLLLNSTISTPNARFATIDIKDFYLNTVMKWEDRVYMRIPISQIPPKIVRFYNLMGMVHNGFVYVEITKGMYGLKQAGKLANEQLIVHLAKHGYAPCSITPGLWRHQTRDIVFTLVVDDFGVRYTRMEDFEHLVAAPEEKYLISIDMTGTKYCGMAIRWDYEQGTCDISMPGYIERALARFQHDKPNRAQHAPHPWLQPDYGARAQLTAAPDESAKLNKKEITRVQEILGTLLYYARAIDSTMLTAISSLSSEQATGTENTMRKITHLLNYCATHPSAVIRYNRSDMILHVESDASYLSETRARSRAAGYYYLSRAPNQPGQPPAPTDAEPPMNGAITVLCNIMREVVSSAAEAELAALFYNAREAVSIRIALNEMGHPQPATPIVTDNSTASGIINDTVRQRRSKAIDMRFYWVRDRSRKGDFIIYWKKGVCNRADYFSKHHPGKHHTEMRPLYLLKEDTPQAADFVASLAYLCIRASTAGITPNDDDDDDAYAALSVSEFLALLSHGPM